MTSTQSVPVRGNTNGTAPTGTAEASPAWTIYRITTNSAGDVLSEQSATGAWSNKETLTYS